MAIPAHLKGANFCGGTPAGGYWLAQSFPSPAKPLMWPGPRQGAAAHSQRPSSLAGWKDGLMVEVEESVHCARKCECVHACENMFSIGYKCAHAYTYVCECDCVCIVAGGACWHSHPTGRKRSVGVAG